MGRKRNDMYAGPSVHTMVKKLTVDRNLSGSSWADKYSSRMAQVKYDLNNVDQSQSNVNSLSSFHSGVFGSSSTDNSNTQCETQSASSAHSYQHGQFSNGQSFNNNTNVENGFNCNKPNFNRNHTNPSYPKTTPPPPLFPSHNTSHDINNSPQNLNYASQNKMVNNENSNHNVSGSSLFSDSPVRVQNHQGPFANISGSQSLQNVQHVSNNRTTSVYNSNQAPNLNQIPYSAQSVPINPNMQNVSNRSGKKFSTQSIPAQTEIKSLEVLNKIGKAPSPLDLCNLEKQMSNDEYEKMRIERQNESTKIDYELADSASVTSSNSNMKSSSSTTPSDVSKMSFQQQLRHAKKDARKSESDWEAEYQRMKKARYENTVSNENSLASTSSQVSISEPSTSVSRHIPKNGNIGCPGSFQNQTHRGIGFRGVGGAFNAGPPRFPPRHQIPNGGMNINFGRFNNPNRFPGSRPSRGFAPQFRSQRGGGNFYFRPHPRGSNRGYY